MFEWIFWYKGTGAKKLEGVVWGERDGREGDERGGGTKSHKTILCTSVGQPEALVYETKSRQAGRELQSLQAKFQFNTCFTQGTSAFISRTSKLER